MKSFIAYHGSPNKFNSFSLSTFGRHDAGMYGEGIYLTDRKEVALGFSEGGYLYKCQVTLNNPLIISADNPQEVADLVMDRGSKAATKKLQSKGYDGIIVKNDHLYNPEDIFDSIIADQYIVFDPKNIKILNIEDLSSSKNGNNMLSLEEAINMVGKKFTLDESIADNGINNMDASEIDENSKEHIEVPFQYADAIKNHKKKIKQSAENTEEIVKMADEVVKENNKDTHRVPKTEPLKKMKLSEELFEDYKEETLNEDEPTKRYNFVKQKEVVDSDGFTDEYTMYYDTQDDRYVFVFGDTDIYDPNEYDTEYFDYETDDENAAYEWFDNYVGPREDDVDDDHRFDDWREENDPLYGYGEDDILKEGFDPKTIKECIKEIRDALKPGKDMLAQINESLREGDLMDMYGMVEYVANEFKKALPSISDAVEKARSSYNS